jgi:Tol biopolymer transport system component
VFANTRATNQVWSLPADLNTGKVLGQLARVTPDLVEAQFPDVRPDGSMLAYISRKQGGQGVFVMDLKTGRDRNLFMAEGNSAYTTFSPDGTKIAFAVTGRNWPAMVVPTAGGEAKQVGSTQGRIRGWSQDGRFLLVWRPPAGAGEKVYIFDIASGKSTEILIAPDMSVSSPRFSPDNRWIAFQTRSADRFRTWVAPFRGAQPVPRSAWVAIADDAINPFWSPDSRSLYYYRSTLDLPGRQPALSSQGLMRQPLDESGQPHGPAADFYRFTGMSFSGSLLNTVSATRDKVYFLLSGGQSDVWMMTLPD